jgi:hypothetical protein
LSCKVGEEVAKVNGKCAYYDKPSELEKVQHECCETFVSGVQDVWEIEGPTVAYDDGALADDDDENNDEDNEIESLLCGENHGCDYDCEIRGDRAICLCDKGFVLSNNGRSCIVSCPTGYEFNNSTQKCEGL